jgi:branched-chain amino acid transport system permease protein
MDESSILIFFDKELMIVEVFLYKFFLGVVTGGSYGLVLFMVASGLTLIFGVAGVLNFAHGSLYMLGAYFAYFVMIHFGIFGVALILGSIGVGVVGILIEKFFIRRVYDAPHLFQILLMYAFMLIFDDLVSIAAGPTVKDIAMPAMFRRPPIFWFGVPIPVYYLFILAMSVAIVVALRLFLFSTRFGKIVRAGATDPEMLGVVGVNKPLVFTMIFGLGSILAGLGGALAAPLRSINPGMGELVLMDSFIIVVIGGIGSIKGAFVAAVLLGLIKSWGTMTFPLLEAAMPFVLMAVILLLRPQGLFGKPAREA